MSTVKNYTIDQLIKTCTQLGVPLSENYDQMKNDLAFMMAKKEVEQEHLISQKILDDTFKAKELMRSDKPPVRA